MERQDLFVPHRRHMNLHSVVALRKRTHNQLQGILPDEVISVRIPEGCQNEQVVKIKGKGLYRFRGDTRGDLFVHINVIVPRNLTKRQRELLEDLAAELGDDVSGKRTPLQAIRDAFSGQ